MLEEGGSREWELEEGDGRRWRENGSLRRGDGRWKGNGCWRRGDVGCGGGIGAGGGGDGRGWRGRKLEDFDWVMIKFPTPPKAL